MADTIEKLVELMAKADEHRDEICVGHGCERCAYEPYGECGIQIKAEYLIANGVTVQRWIPVTERLPEEHDSIFAPFYGTEKWVSGMFRTISDDVNACVEYEDGTRKVKTLHTFDGKWNLKGMGGKKVTYWMPLPEPPKGE